MVEEEAEKERVVFVQVSRLSHPTRLLLLFPGPGHSTAGLTYWGPQSPLEGWVKCSFLGPLVQGVWVGRELAALTSPQGVLKLQV